MSARTDRIARIRAKITPDASDRYPLGQLADYIETLTDAQYETWIAANRARDAEALAAYHRSNGAASCN